MAQKSREYWRKRYDLLEESLLGIGEDYVELLDRQYQAAIRTIEKDVLSWYARLASNNSVSLSEAKRLLTTKELKEFRWDLKEYIRHAEESAVNQQWIKQLENASAKVHIERLQVLELQMRQQLELLYANRAQGLTATARNIYSEGYYSSIYEAQRGLGVGYSFQKLDEKGIARVLSQPWAPDGKNFSDRIWEDKQKLINTLQTELVQALIRGDSPDKTIQALAKKMGSSRSNAARLVLTESSFFSNSGLQRSFEELGVEEEEFVATLDSSTSTICREMDGKVFKRSEVKIGVSAPPLHARCRSVMVPYFDDNATTRMARGKDGKSYSVPGDMKYGDWKRTHVDGAGKSENTTKENTKSQIPDNDIYKKTRSLPLRSYESFSRKGARASENGVGILRK